MMSQQIGKETTANNEKQLQEQISNLDSYTHNEIEKLYKFINDKITISIQSNCQTLSEFRLRLDKFEDKLQQQAQTSNLFNNELNSIKQQLVQIKQENSENFKLNQLVEGKIPEILEPNNQLINSNTETSSSTSDIEFLKSEIKLLKEKMNSSSAYIQTQDIVSPISQINVIQTEDDEFLSNQLKAENRKIKSDLSSIKSEIKKIISRALDNENTEIKDLSFDEESAAILRSNYETTSDSNDSKIGDEENYSELNFDEIDINQNSQKSSEIAYNNEINSKINKLMMENELLKNDFNSLKIEIGKLIENQNQSAAIPDKFINEISKQIENCNNKSNQIKETFGQIISENESLKKNYNNIQSDIDRISKKLDEQEEEITSDKSYYIPSGHQYKAFETSFTVNDIQLKAIEANNNSINAQYKANEAVFKASEAESKALAANEKSDRIVSDNDKMNVDIRCLKYEVKKLRSRINELENSEIYSALSERIDYTLSKVHKLKCEVRHMKSGKAIDVNDLNSPLNDDKISNIKEENDSLKEDIKVLKSEIMKIKEDQISNEITNIPDDYIQKIKDAHTQSSRAYEKASKMHRDISENLTKTNEVNDKVDKLIGENEKLKIELNTLITEVDKIKETQRAEEDYKSQKKKDKKNKHSAIKI